MEFAWTEEQCDNPGDGWQSQLCRVFGLQSLITLSWTIRSGMEKSVCTSKHFEDVIWSELGLCGRIIFRVGTRGSMLVIPSWLIKRGMEMLKILGPGFAGYQTVPAFSYISLAGFRTPPGSHYRGSTPFLWVPIVGTSHHDSLFHSVHHFLYPSFSFPQRLFIAMPTHRSNFLRGLIWQGSLDRKGMWGSTLFAFLCFNFNDFLAQLSSQLSL